MIKTKKFNPIELEYMEESAPYTDYNNSRKYKNKYKNKFDNKFGDNLLNAIIGTSGSSGYGAGTNGNFGGGVQGQNINKLEDIIEKLIKEKNEKLINESTEKIISNIIKQRTPQEIYQIIESKQKELNNVSIVNDDIQLEIFKEYLSTPTLNIENPFTLDLYKYFLSKQNFNKSFYFFLSPNVWTYLIKKYNISVNAEIAKKNSLFFQYMINHSNKKWLINILDNKFKTHNNSNLLHILIDKYDIDSIKLLAEKCKGLKSKEYINDTIFPYLKYIINKHCNNLFSVFIDSFELDIKNQFYILLKDAIDNNNIEIVILLLEKFYDNQDLKPYINTLIRLNNNGINEQLFKIDTIIFDIKSKMFPSKIEKEFLVKLSEYQKQQLEIKIEKEELLIFDINMPDLINEKINKIQKTLIVLKNNNFKNEAIKNYKNVLYAIDLYNGNIKDILNENNILLANQELEKQLDLILECIKVYLNEIEIEKLNKIKDNTLFLNKVII